MIADALTKASARKVFFQLLSQRQEWRLVCDPEFTAGRKLNKREHERISQEMAVKFVKALQHFSEEQSLPWDEPSLEPTEEDSLLNDLRGMTGVRSRGPMINMYTWLRH